MIYGLESVACGPQLVTPFSRRIQHIDLFSWWYLLPECMKLVTEV